LPTSTDKESMTRSAAKPLAPVDRRAMRETPAPRTLPTPRAGTSMRPANVVTDEARRSSNDST
jgi:hypothetical protein